MEREAILTYLLAGIWAAFKTICTKDDVSPTDTVHSVLYFTLGGTHKGGLGAAFEIRVTGSYRDMGSRISFAWVKDFSPCGPFLLLLEIFFNIVNKAS